MARKKLDPALDNVAAGMPRDAFEVPGLRRTQKDIGKVLAAGAAFAIDRVKILKTAHGVVQGPAEDIIIIHRWGIEALLRDAYAAGFYSKEQK